MAEGPRRVLIVEDHQELRSATVFLVQSWGHEVRSAADGDRGLALALAWKPDVVCLDLALPRLRGEEVARRIVADCGSERPLLIAISGYGNDIEREIAKAAGCDVFLLKPYVVDLLEAAVRGDPLPDEIVLSSRPVRARR
jgi:CheY-like chemotaxis protein